MRKFSEQGVIAGRFRYGSLSQQPEVETKTARHRGQANADRTSTAALTTSFTGTLIGPLMSLEKVVKAMKMESVPPGWHAIITALLAVFIYEPQPLVSLLLEGSLLCRNAAALLRSVPGPLLSPRFVFCSVLASKLAHFRLRQRMAAASVCVFIISSVAI